jgi:hypothetical protein
MFQLVVVVCLSQPPLTECRAFQRQADDPREMCEALLPAQLDRIKAALTASGYGATIHEISGMCVLSPGAEA